MSTGIYYALFNLLCPYLYGTDVVMTPYQELTLTLVCTIGALFVIAIPFLVVWRCIRLFV